MLLPYPSWLSDACLGPRAPPRVRCAGAVLRHIGGGSASSCVFPALSSMLTPLFFFGPGTLAAYRTFKMRDVQRMLARKGAAMDVNVAETTRRRTSAKVLLSVFAAATLFACAVTALRVLVIAPETYAGEGRDCTLTGVERQITTSWIAVLSLAYAGSMCRLRHLESDVFGQLLELRVNGMLALVCLPVWWALGPTAPLRTVGATVLHSSAWVSLWACASVSVAALVPALMTWSSRYAARPSIDSSLTSPTLSAAAWSGTSRDGTSTVDERVLRSIERTKREVERGNPLRMDMVLEVPRLRGMFIAHLEKEFCVELIAFHAVSREGVIARDARRMGISEFDRRKWIVDTFIRDGAPMQVNISHEAQKAALSSFVVDEEEITDEIGTFGAARKEVLDLMQRFAWPRFGQTREFTQATELVMVLPPAALLEPDQTAATPAVGLIGRGLQLMRRASSNSHADSPSMSRGSRDPDPAGSVTSPLHAAPATSI